ncbi:putative aminotransferase TAT2 [Wolffia australiana]
MAPTAQMNSSNGKAISFKAARCNPCLSEQSSSLRGVVAELMACANPDKPVVSLGVGDLSGHPSFRGAHHFAQFVADAVVTGDFDGYPPSCGYPFSRRAVAEYLARGVAAAGETATADPDDVFLTCGGTQALQVCLAALATRGCNVLLPRPGFPPYDAACAIYAIEPRYYDLSPVNGWEVDLARVKALADDRTAAIVVINPNNPCGAVYSRRHLLQRWRGD